MFYINKAASPHLIVTHQGAISTINMLGKYIDKRHNFPPKKVVVLDYSIKKKHPHKHKNEEYLLHIALKTPCLYNCVNSS